LRTALGEPPSVGTKQMVPATKPKDARHDPSLILKPENPVQRAAILASR